MKYRFVILAVLAIAFLAADVADAQRGRRWFRRGNNNANCNNCQSSNANSNANANSISVTEAVPMIQPVSYEQPAVPHQDAVVANSVAIQPATIGAQSTAPATYQPVASSSQFISAAGVGIVDPNVGYAGPGDMRTHLWNDHADDLQANGISYSQLYSLSMDRVQQWHNQFHAEEMRQLGQQSNIQNTQMTSYPVTPGYQTAQPATEYYQAAPVQYSEPVYQP